MKDDPFPVALIPKRQNRIFPQFYNLEAEACGIGALVIEQYNMTYKPMSTNVKFIHLRHMTYAKEKQLIFNNENPKTFLMTIPLSTPQSKSRSHAVPIVGNILPKPFKCVWIYFLNDSTYLRK